ncbi:hypothetical protein MMC32_006080 [Xylographa parallela]|nr:hypothetical protein [Xylographa parallela]
MSAYPPEKAGQPGSHALPTRTTTGTMSDDEAVPDANPSDTAGILQERLQAWKHAVGYIENYFTATEKVEKAHAKEYEKVLKSISDPLKEGHHFDQSLGGIAGMFENMRSNTQGIANSHLETAKNISGSVLPILARLHTEIKNKSKELTHGAAKGAKNVTSARNETQKYIEALGQYTATFDSSGGKIDPPNDPYLLHRGIQYRLHKQVLEENNSRQDLIAVQDNFQSFEAHVIQAIQQSMSAFLQYVGGQAERQKAMYTDMTSTTQRIPPEFEWMNFLHRNGNLMIDPSSPKRSMSSITYPNQDHHSIKPLIAGTLERKSRALGGLTGYKTGYYAVTPSKYLHQFDDDDNFRKEPTAELSLYLPDCTIGAVSDCRFNVKGKDSSKGKVGTAFQMNHEFSFKANTEEDAFKWWKVISEAAGAFNVTSEPPSAASSPVSSRNVSGPPAYVEKHAPPVQTQGLPLRQGPASAGPQSALGQEARSAGSGVAPHSAGPIESPITVATETGKGLPP